LEAERVRELCRVRLLEGAAAANVDLVDVARPLVQDGGVLDLAAVEDALELELPDRAERSQPGQWHERRGERVGASLGGARGWCDARPRRACAARVGDVLELVGEQAFAGTCVRPVLAGAENDVVAHGRRAGAQRAGEGRSSAIVVHADATEILAE